VWQQGSHSLRFVPVATAASGARGDGPQPPSSQPASA
jgi:hypothetical protein